MTVRTTPPALTESTTTPASVPPTTQVHTIYFYLLLLKTSVFAPRRLGGSPSPSPTTRTDKIIFRFPGKLVMGNLSAVTWNCSYRRLKEQWSRRERGTVIEKWQKMGVCTRREQQRVKKWPLKAWSSEREGKRWLGGVQQTESKLLTGKLSFPVL